MSIKIKKTNMASIEEESWFKGVYNRYYTKLSSYHEYKRDMDDKYDYMRVQSLDYIRGILVILSLLIINQGMETLTSPVFLNSSWNGMTLTDIVVSMFVLLTGSSVPFYVKKHYEEDESLRSIVKRGLIKSIIVRSEERRVGKECRSRWSP